MITKSWLDSPHLFHGWQYCFLFLDWQPLVVRHDVSPFFSMVWKFHVSSTVGRLGHDVTLSVRLYGWLRLPSNLGGWDVVLEKGGQPQREGRWLAVGRGVASREERRRWRTLEERGGATVVERRTELRILGEWSIVETHDA